MRLSHTSSSRITVPAGLPQVTVRSSLVCGMAILFSILAPDVAAQETKFTDLIQLGPGVQLPTEVLNQPAHEGLQLIKSTESDDSESTPTLAQLIQGIRPTDEQMRLLDEGLIRPEVLRDALQAESRLPYVAAGEDHTTYPLTTVSRGYPYGFAGPSGVLPSESQTSDHFIPVEDRWRMGAAESDRYGKGHPIMDDYPGVEGAWWDPYNENVLKGDYPVIGRHTFLKLTARSLNLFEGRELPTPTTPFESTRNPGLDEFFGNPNQFVFAQYDSLAIELFHGNSSFKPVDWRVRANLIYNMNSLNVGELGVVNPSVLEGTSRFRQDFALEEWFAEAKLTDLSPYYDFASVRAGSQLFVSDFRGFIFSDVNRGVRLFGTRHSNRDQFNLMWFDQTEKETNSLLNIIDEDRQQNTFIANYYRSDFLYPGFNVNMSYHHNHDQATRKFDKNNFLVRPDPVGVAQPHDIQAHYFGAATNGHIERVNISSAFYYANGRDTLNPIAGRRVDISAYLAALELSYDRDWVRFRTSYFYNSGDSDPNDSKATGFDAIMPNPNFAGNEFSYWGRQGIRLFGSELTNRLSLNPSLKQSKFQGQTNFVNPGIHLFNVGLDADITPRLKSINNVNAMWFDKTDVLETYLFVGEVRDFIGTDISSGLEYRPLQNNNILLLGGLSTLISGEGFKDLFQTLDGKVDNPVAGFLEVTFEY